MPSLNYESEVLRDRIMSADTLSHDTLTLKFTLATNHIDNLERKRRRTWHKIQHTSAIVSASGGGGAWTYYSLEVHSWGYMCLRKAQNAQEEDSKSPRYFHQSSGDEYKYTDGVQTSFFFFANTWTQELIPLNDYKLSYVCLVCTFTKFAMLMAAKGARSLIFFTHAVDFSFFL